MSKPDNYTEFFVKLYNIENCAIYADGSVDVNGDVDISGKKLKRIPIKFNIIRGDFNCSYNKLITLENSPKYIHGDFLCYYNNLKNLKYGPKFVLGRYNCSYNRLTSIHSIPINLSPEKIHYNNNLLLKQKDIDDFWEDRIRSDASIFMLVYDRISDDLKKKYIHMKKPIEDFDIFEE